MQKEAIDTMCRMAARYNYDSVNRIIDELKKCKLSEENKEFVDAFSEALEKGDSRLASRMFYNIKS